MAEPVFDTPEAVVSWLGAVQAQDWYGSLWAVGSRMRAASESTIEQAIADGSIVRTWPMRGTLHFVAPADVRWMLQLLAPRVVAANRARIERDFGLDESTLKRSRRIVEKVLGVGQPIARTDLYAALDAGGIGTERMRGIHVTGWLAHHGVICGGPRVGRQPTFVLLDAWVAPTTPKTRDEALHTLALRYFHSHGPATAQDLAWWSGLTVRDAQLAAALAEPELQVLEVAGKRYLHGDTAEPMPAGGVHLLAPFDEYLVGYRDRRAAVEPALSRQVIGINGLVNASVLVDGKVVGTWKRVLGRDGVSIDVAPFRALRRGEQAPLKRAMKRYAAFIGKKLL
ncbi:MULTISPECIES: winged helix DNA-binding domain-containing protein [unclassified Lysobacter]|uniref:winged helix DNA-binding domain-containing protein n=1 Tax=unclassified Lysobacter TaxID=2635362 RepID=UPI001F562BDC|nr:MULTISPECIES: winged helix DNA-binding domain-containing protein [unclassified Lysobacter]